MTAWWGVAGRQVLSHMINRLTAGSLIVSWYQKCVKTRSRAELRPRSDPVRLCGKSLQGLAKLTSFCRVYKSWKNVVGHVLGVINDRVRVKCAKWISTCVKSRKIQYCWTAASSMKISSQHIFQTSFQHFLKSPTQPRISQHYLGSWRIYHCYFLLYFLKDTESRMQQMSQIKLLLDPSGNYRFYQVIASSMIIPTFHSHSFVMTDI